MDIQERNGIKVYGLSTGRPLPVWLGERARRNLSKRDESVRRRVDLIQDFEFPSSSTRVRQSPDGRFIVAIGTYKPNLKCFELSEMAMKFERRLDAEGVDFLFLGDDYGKIAVLQDNRVIQFHAPYGAHYGIRVPSFGRALAYEQEHCDLLVTSSHGDVYRINLAEGKFGDSLTFNPKDGSPRGTTAIAVSPTHSLTSVGCEDGCVRFWDSRAGLTPFVSLDVGAACSGLGFADLNDPMTKASEVTAVAWAENGINLAVGTGGGCVALYDVRSERPLHIKEHQYGMPIHTVLFHKGSESVMSGDKKLVKIWRTSNKDSSFADYSDGGSLFGGGSDGFDGSDDAPSRPSSSSRPTSAAVGVGSIVCNIESLTDMCHFMVSGDELDPSGSRSGLVLCAGAQSRIQTFYAPAVGNAPRWCSFLDGITEELEEKALETDIAEGGGKTATTETVYEDYKFITREEVEQFGIGNLVGTPLLRGYMHGFFIDSSLYSRVRSVVNPFEYQEYRKRKIKEKIEEKQASRITPKQKPKASVNADLVSRLEDKKKEGKRAGKDAASLLADDRFGSLFKNPDFAIDENAEDFKLRNPSGVAAGKKAQRYGNEDDDMDSDRDDSGDDDDDKTKKKAAAKNKKGGKSDVLGFSKVKNEWGADGSDDDDDDDDEDYDRGITDAYDVDSDNEDGFKGARVRGDKFASSRESKKSSKKDKMVTEDAPSKKKKVKRMMEADDIADGDALSGLGNLEASSKLKQRKDLGKQDLGSRVSQLKQQEESTKTLRKLDKKGVVREFTFTPKSETDKAKKRDGGADERKEKRRGVKDLGFKTQQAWAGGGKGR